MADLLRLVCSSCDTPFIAKGDQSCSLPLCGRCKQRANALCAIKITALSAHERRALARSVVQLAFHVRKGKYATA